MDRACLSFQRSFYWCETRIHLRFRLLEAAAKVWIFKANKFHCRHVSKIFRLARSGFVVIFCRILESLFWRQRIKAHAATKWFYACPKAKKVRPAAETDSFAAPFPAGFAGLRLLNFEPDIRKTVFSEHNAFILQNWNALNLLIWMKTNAILHFFLKQPWKERWNILYSLKPPNLKRLMQEIIGNGASLIWLKEVPFL